jgi:DNA repair exonuclease SbcCD ATPase subunit
MRISKVTLKDFGQHELLEADFNAPVVGVLGINGAGKSTLLAALRFAFTGILDDENDSYVRNRNAAGETLTDCPSNGSVCVTFTAGDKECTIFRQVGKSPRHQLDIGERSGKNAVKNVKEIQQILGSLIGADQQALDNAVFIQQGEMQNLLLGDNTAREKLYARMLLVSFCEQIYSKANERATKLGAGLKDLQATQDEATAATAACRQELHRLIGDSNAYPALAKDAVSTFENWARNRGILIGGELNLTALQQETRMAGTRAIEARANLLTVTECESVASAEKRVKAAADSLASATKTAALLASAAGAKTQLEQAHAAVTAADADAARAAKDVADVLATLEGASNSAALELKLTQSANYRKAKQDMATNRSRLFVITGQLPELDREMEELRVQGIAAADARNAAKQAEAEPKIRYELLSTISKSLGQSTCCPVCDSAVAAGKFGSEAVESARLKLKEAEAHHTHLQGVYEGLRAKYQCAQVTQKALLAEQSQLSQQATEILRLVQVDDISQLSLHGMTDEMEAQTKALLQTVRTAESRLPVLRSNSAAAATRQTKAMVDLVNAHAREQTAREACAGLTADPSFDRNAQEVLVVKLYQAWSTMTDASAAVTQAESAQTAAALRNQETAATCATLEAEINGFHALTTILARATGQDVSAQTYIEACRKLIGDYQQVCAEMRAKVDQQTKMVSEMETRENQVREAIERNEKQRALVDDMRAVARVFHRDGLPIYYMRQRFGEIAELTSYFLGKLESDFLIRADPERAVAFQFARLQDGAEVWFNQEKLSGGQRVRLTVAFLLAVQQLVIPDVGLLILDEPSMHLDPESKESLSAMLRELGPRLQEQGAQLVVCDHAEEIIRSLPKQVVLTPRIRSAKQDV